MQQIGVVIPYLNCEHYVEELVLSLESKYPLKIFLYNNGSKEGIDKTMSERVLEGDVEYVRSFTNIGVAAAWNRGLHHLFSFENINNVLVLNNDVLLHPEAIDRLVAAIDSNYFPIITGTDVAKQCARPVDINTIRLPDAHYYTDAPEFSCFMISRAGYKMIGDFDTKFFPAYYEDNDYHYRAKLLKERLVKLNTALYYHYGSRTIRENKDVDDVVNTYYLQNERYYVTKWGGKPGEEKYKTPFNEQKNE